MYAYMHKKKNRGHSEPKFISNTLYVPHIPLSTSKCLHPSYDHFH